MRQFEREMGVVEAVNGDISSTDLFMKLAQETESARVNAQAAQDGRAQSDVAKFNADVKSIQDTAAANTGTATSAPDVGVAENRNAAPQPTNVTSDATTATTTRGIARHKIPEGLRNYPQHLQSHFLLQHDQAASAVNAAPAPTSSEVAAHPVQTNDQVPQGVITTESTKDAQTAISPQEQVLADKYLLGDKSTHARSNMTELLTSQGFTNADGEARSASINAVGHHVSDTSFRRGVDRLLNDPKFQALSAAEKANAIKAYDQFASSSAYRGGMLTLHVEKQAKAAALDSLRTVVTAPGFHKMQADAQQAAVSALENNRPNEVADSIAQLSNSAGFQEADSQKQVEWLKGLETQGTHAVHSDSAGRREGPKDNVVANHQFGNEKVEFLATRNKDNQKLEISATYTGLGGIKRSASLGQYDIDPSKAVNLKVEPSAQDGKSIKLSLQDGSNAITIGHDISYRREQGLTTRYHSLTAPNGRGELSLFPTERVVFPNDPKPTATDEQPRYDANTENMIARERVAELPDGQIKSDIIKDLDSGQPLTAERAARLNASAYRATHAFKILDNLDKMAHPSSVSGEINKEIESTRQKTEAALKASYGSDVNAYEAARADAEQSQASLQARIATHYAGVVQKQIDQKDALENDIRAAQAKEGGESGKAVRAETNRRLGVEVGPDGKPIKTAAEKDRAELAELRGDLERGDNNQASAKIFALYEKNQRDIQEQSVMAMQAQAHRYKKDLNSVFDKYFLPGKSRTPYAKSYEKEFNGYLKDFDAAKAERSQAEKQFAEAKTPEEREAAQHAYAAANKKWNDTYSAFLKTVTSPRFERDISKIQNRIGKVEFARTTSIVIASSVVGGVVGMGARLAIGAAAGRVVGAVNATRIAGTGAFLAETTAFTATERALSNSPDGTFTKDLLTNFAMFGAMKGAGKWYEQSFKSAKETSPLLYRTGQIGSEITTAHVANEAAFRVENGRFMNRDERVQSLASAGVMVPGLHAGAWAVKRAAQARMAARDNWVAKEFNNAKDLSEVPGISAEAPLVANDKLAGNKLHVGYDMVDGKPTNFRLEYNPKATYSWDDLASHAQAIKALRATGTMRERVGQWFKGEKPLPPGSLGWEARHEINKLADRAQRTAARLDAPGLSPAERTRLRGELADIHQQAEHYSGMLDKADVGGRGYIAQDSSSTQLAKARGLPTGDQLPPHHYWRSRTRVDANGVEATELFLQRTDASKTDLHRYNEKTGKIESVPGTRVSAHPERFDYEVNRQNIPISYLDEVAKATGRTRAKIEARYDQLAATGADYQSLIKNYVETNPYGIDLKEAHLIMGYTTNFFQKRLNRRIFSGNILGRSERELINSLNSAFDKLPSQEGVFRRGLGTTPDWFDEKYAVKGKVFETHFASVSKHLSSNYRRDKVMEFRSRHVKDISALAMDVQFSKQIGRKAAASEYLIQANSKFIVLKVNRKRSKYILGDYD